MVVDRPFKVENPFLWKTKGEIVELIARAGCAEMIGFSTSCTHVWEMTTLNTHCGTCSQCIDRRFAVLAAGQETHDPDTRYKVDLLTGERSKNEHRTMLATYVETANEIQKADATGFFSKFGEASRVLRHIDGTPESAAQRIFDLHKRHAAEVAKVIDAGLSKHAAALRQHEFHPSSLLRLAFESNVPAEQTRPGPHVRPLPNQAMPPHTFLRKGQAWLVRFDGGKDFILLPTKGAAYLQLLLSNPRTVFKVTDLVFQVAKTPAEFILGDSGPMLDKEAQTAYRAKHGDLQEELAEAERNNDLGQQAKLRSEIEWLEGEAKKAVGLGGRARKLDDVRDRVRKSFRAAIRRVVEEIAKCDKVLAAHLKPPRLKCGWNPSYNPPADIAWDV